jgi:endonuclease III
MENLEGIVSMLVQKGQEILDKPKAQIVRFVRNSKYSQGNEADRLLNDFKNFPHAFVISCIADKQVDADTAWLTPYNISLQVESFEIKHLAKIELSRFKEIMENANPKHRFHKMIAEEIHSGINHIMEAYNGNAAKIWDLRGRWSVR